MNPDILAKMDAFALERLSDFVPDNVFDAHVHLFDEHFTTYYARNKTADALECFDWERYRNDMAGILPGRTIHANIISYPDKHMATNVVNRDASDAFTVAQLEKDPLGVGEIMVLPTDTTEELEKRLIHPRIKGFKCYHLLAKQDGPTFQCQTEEFLPESAWEVAHARGLVITLHMVRDAALSDPDNLNYIKTMAKRYPNATLILAHAARSFASWTGLEAVEYVAHLDNVWFDFSAVCESPAMFQILKKAGHSRCMWGTDYPISQWRGKCLSLGSGFQWLYEKELEAIKAPGAWHIATETLMALRQAAIMAELTSAQVEDVFYNNAICLFHGK